MTGSNFESRIVVPGDTVPDIETASSENSMIVLGPGLRRDTSSVVVSRAGLLRKRSQDNSEIYWVDCHRFVSPCFTIRVLFYELFQFSANDTWQHEGNQWLELWPTKVESHFVWTLERQNQLICPALPLKEQPKRTGTHDGRLFFWSWLSIILFSQAKRQCGWRCLCQVVGGLKRNGARASLCGLVWKEGRSRSIIGWIHLFCSSTCDT